MDYLNQVPKQLSISIWSQLPLDLKRILYFVNAGALVEGLKNANLNGILEKKLKALAKYDVLIIDEMRYLPFDRQGAHCFFQLVSRRYERSSMIFTSNKSYGGRGERFHDYVIAVAILDRILNHFTTIDIKGESYRLKERKKHGLITMQK